MYYSPLVTGTSLLIVGHVAPGSTLLAEIARGAVDVCGAAFLLMGALLVLLSLYGSVQGGLERRRAQRLEARTLPELTDSTVVPGRMA